MISISKNLNEVLHSVTCVDTFIEVISDGTTYQWYKCDDYDHTNSVEIVGETTNSLNVTKEEVENNYYYCIIGNGIDTPIPSTTCKVETKRPEAYLTSLARDREVLANALTSFNGDGKNYLAMNYEELINEVLQLKVNNGNNTKVKVISYNNILNRSYSSADVGINKDIYELLDYCSSNEILDSDSMQYIIIWGGVPYFFYGNDNFDNSITFRGFTEVIDESTAELKTYTIIIRYTKNNDIIKINDIYGSSRALTHQATKYQYGFVKVDGETITASNGIISSKGVQSDECKSIKILTQDEYDALGNDVNNDNILYIIRD